ncbi:GNAT family N-acetyltransferase [Acidovorax sp. sic0104]|uniref:GNAT family N-acetyltransferase n=1 Tax=Acidovorax sp. sic0104 TaxID=2854784 RepID=UPI001C44E0C8|nr:GNAT family N-acetyltransferase [Acidovorax sp. sic0104]MBV7543567.1 GNAT family N-acetyltransferase [Acidovorax sp. sic0104]
MTLCLLDLAPAVALRPAAPDDVLRLARLWRDAWSSANPSAPAVAPLPHWEARVRAEFGAPHTALLAERADGTLLAFMVLDLRRSHLEQLFVAPAAQGQGLGAAMVREICARLCPAGWTLEPVQDLFGDRIGVQSG